MPFFNHLGPGPDVYSTEAKENLRLTQLGSEPVSEKTSFTCNDTFGWSDSAPGTPPPESRVSNSTNTDLASIPPFLWGLISSYGRHTMPAILHDVRCDAAVKVRKGDTPGGSPYAAYLRRQADQQFRHTLRVHADKGVVTRYIMWSAVRLFGSLPIAAAVVLAVLVSLLHLSEDAFVAVSKALSQVTIWPWLSWLDFIPRGIASGLARLSKSLHPDQPFAMILVVLLAVAVVFTAWRSIERQAPDGSASFSVNAFVSMLCASLIGALSAPPLLPLVVVTVITRLVLWILDLICHLLERLFRKALQALAGSTPANVTIPERALQGTALPPFPGLFPSP